MRRFLFPAALAMGLAFMPSTAQASWLSEALHRLRGDYPYPGYYSDYVSPGYSDYGYVSPGYSVDPGYYDYGYAPAFSVGYVGPYGGYRRWGYRHHYYPRYGYGGGYGGYRTRVAYGGYGYRAGVGHAAYRAYGRAGFAGGVHHGRLR